MKIRRPQRMGMFMDRAKLLDIVRALHERMFDKMSSDSMQRWRDQIIHGQSLDMVGFDCNGLFFKDHIPYGDFLC